MTKVNTEQAARAIVVCLQCNIPVALWSEPGAGKSSIIAQTAKRLKWGFYDVRLSDKEPSDFALPFPKDGALSYLMSDLLPFDTDEKCIVLFDEYDRAMMNTQNMSLQLTLDRACFGHKLSPNARIVLAGNQASDIGTNQLSEAAATRMVHLYLETQSDTALEEWLKWADKEGVSPTMQSFAKFRMDVWAGPDRKDLVEYAKPTKRTFEMADRIYQMTTVLKLKTDDILRPLIEGVIGTEAANEFLGWIRLCEQTPSIEDIVADPHKAALPTDIGVTYALCLHMVREAKKDEATAEPMLVYAMRWPAEQTAFFARQIAKAIPSIQATRTFQKWEAARMN